MIVSTRSHISSNNVRVYGNVFVRCWQGGSRDRSICREMQCWVAELGQCYAGVEQRAFDGTTCGNQSWCIVGNCISSEQAPDAPGQWRYNVLAYYHHCFSADKMSNVNCQ